MWTEDVFSHRGRFFLEIFLIVFVHIAGFKDPLVQLAGSALEDYIFHLAVSRARPGLYAVARGEPASSSEPHTGAEEPVGDRDLVRCRRGEARPVVAEQEAGSKLRRRAKGIQAPVVDGAEPIPGAGLRAPCAAEENREPAVGIRRVHCSRAAVPAVALAAGLCELHAAAARAQTPEASRRRVGASPPSPSRSPRVRTACTWGSATAPSTRSPTGRAALGTRSTCSGR